jgi:hypothetical protein
MQALNEALGPRMKLAGETELLEDFSGFFQERELLTGTQVCTHTTLFNLEKSFRCAGSSNTNRTCGHILSKNGHGFDVFFFFSFFKVHPGLLPLSARLHCR